MSQISIKGLDRADVLVALYNAAKPQGMGFMQYDPQPMTRQEAEQLLEQTKVFDYLKGRVMKVNLEGDEFESWLYDRDNGNDAAKKAITTLRLSQTLN